MRINYDTNDNLNSNAAGWSGAISVVPEGNTDTGGGSKSRSDAGKMGRSATSKRCRVYIGALLVAIICAYK